MKKAIVGILIGAVLLSGAVLGGRALYRHFVTDSIADRGGMENPGYTEKMQQEDNQHQFDQSDMTE